MAPRPAVAGQSDTAPPGAARVVLLALAALASLGWLCVVPLRRDEAPARDGRQATARALQTAREH